MSLLGDGASCSTNSNPLQQVDKTFSTDRSLQREHATGSRPPTGQFRSPSRPQLLPQDQQLLQQMQHQNVASFNFDKMRQDVPKFDQQMGRNWGAEFNRQSPQPSFSGQTLHHPPPQHHQTALANEKSHWSQEFAQQNRGLVTAHSSSPSLATPSMSLSRVNPGIGSGMAHGMNLGMPNRTNYSMLPSSAPLSDQRTANWDEVFNQAERDDSTSLDHSEVHSLDRSSTKRSQNSSSQSLSSQTATREGTPLSRHAERHDGNVQTDDPEIYTAQTSALIDALAQDQLAPAASTISESDWLMGSYPPNWNEMWEQINRETPADLSSNQMFSSTLGEYEFQADNEYRNEEDPFALGVYMMDNGAKLSSAVLCFEEAVKRDPQHVEAWARLGDAQAQNEIEDMAINALERAVSLNPQHSAALLNLAISYTNEAYDVASAQILEKWFTARYPQIAEQVNKEWKTNAPQWEDLRNRITKMFLRAAQSSGENGLDPDVQVGLGVLFYRDEDYNKAVDCFKAALSVRPNDASLWNRLGATLANSSQPEEAINSYTQALSLRPSFVRARYNLAVSCINIGCYKEAADHILSAIALHETEENSKIDFDRSANLLDTLRRVFFAMDRRDLLAKLQPGAYLQDFRNEFNF